MAALIHTCNLHALGRTCFILNIDILNIDSAWNVPTLVATNNAMVLAKVNLDNLKCNVEHFLSPSYSNLGF